MDTINDIKKEIIKSKLAKQAEMLRAMAHPDRLWILIKLMFDSSCNVSDLQGCLNVAQPKISQHLSKLKSAGIVTAERNGKEMIYRISNPAIHTILQTIINEN